MFFIVWYNKFINKFIIFDMGGLCEFFFVVVCEEFSDLKFKWVNNYYYCI